MRKHFFASALLFACLSLLLLSCQKEAQPALQGEELSLETTKNNESGHLKQTKTYSSRLLVNWLDLQLVMLKLPLPAGTGSQATDRAQAYCGIALYESVLPGMPAFRSLSGQLTDLPVMPAAEPGKAYHWAASANAALAEMNRKLFPTTAEANKTSINELENTLKESYAAQTDPATLERSIAFGKEVASRVFSWALLDGFANVNPPYIPPVGPGLWIPTSPGPAVNAYAHQRRLMVPGVTEGTALVPPPPYSTDPNSEFYAMVKEVYDASKVLTTDQKAMADYFKDNPGYGAGGGFVSVFSQALDIAKPTLDKAALAYAKVGIAQHEATIILNTHKYIFNTIRPVTYIRAVIDPSWSTYIGTPNHPEFPSGHATTNGSVLSMMSHVFGENFPMTLHTYDYLGYPPRSYQTFTQLGRDMADSRFYGGLHYMPTCNKSLAQGRKIAENIRSKVNFHK